MASGKYDIFMSEVDWKTFNQEPLKKPDQNTIGILSAIENRVKSTRTDLQTLQLATEKDQATFGRQYEEVADILVLWLWYLECHILPFIEPSISKLSESDKDRKTKTGLRAKQDKIQQLQEKIAEDLDLLGKTKRPPRISNRSPEELLIRLRIRILSRDSTAFSLHDLCCSISKLESFKYRPTWKDNRPHTFTIIGTHTCGYFTGATPERFGHFKTLNKMRREHRLKRILPDENIKLQHRFNTGKKLIDNIAKSYEKCAPAPHLKYPVKAAYYKAREFVATTMPHLAYNADAIKLPGLAFQCTKNKKDGIPNIVPRCPDCRFLFDVSPTYLPESTDWSLSEFNEIDPHIEEKEEYQSWCNCAENVAVVEMCRGLETTIRGSLAGGNEHKENATSD